MRKLLLAMAVLATLLPLLEGGEKGRLESGEKLCKGQGNRMVGTKGEADKQPCGKYNTKCGSGASPPCCEQGQDCDTKNGVCKCLQTAHSSAQEPSHCDAMCKQYRNEHGCCVTAVNKNRLCHCCLDNQICDASKGCDCGPELCNKQCAKDPGGFGCCQGTACTCCKKGQTCTATGCKLPCNPTTCRQTCNGKCNPETQICESGCPGHCNVDGECPQSCEVGDDDGCWEDCRSSGFSDGCCLNTACKCCDGKTFAIECTTPNWNSILC